MIAELIEVAAAGVAGAGAYKVTRRGLHRRITQIRREDQERAEERRRWELAGQGVVQSRSSEGWLA